MLKFRCLTLTLAASSPVHSLGIQRPNFHIPLAKIWKRNPWSCSSGVGSPSPVRIWENFKQKSCFEILFVTSLFPCKSQLVGNLLLMGCMLCLTVLTSPSTSLAPWQIFLIKNESDFDKANEHAVYRDLASFQRPSQKKWAGNVFLSSLVRQPEVRWGNLIWGNMGEIISNTRKGNWWLSHGCANLKAGVKGAGMVNDHVAQLPGWRNLCYILGDININIIWKAWDLGWSVKHF